MTSPVVPVAVTFLERLLFDTKPSEAVHTLSNLWHGRVRAGQSQFGLSFPEYNTVLCLVYSGEVGNGGHSQFFGNRGGRYVPDTIEALRAADLSKLASILQQAIEALPGGLVPEGEDERDRVLDASVARLDELDREAFRCLDEVHHRLLVYLRAHQHRILVPETPLELRAWTRRE